MGKNAFETMVGALVLVIAAWFLFFAYKSTRVTTGNGYTLTAKFDRIDGLTLGSDVRVSGLKIGAVTKQIIDPKTYLAIITMDIDEKVKLPKDSAAEIISDGLLGGKYVALVPGADDTMLSNGEEVKFTQSAISIESLIGKFIFGSADDEKKADDADATKNEDDIFKL